MKRSQTKLHAPSAHMKTQHTRCPYALKNPKLALLYYNMNLTKPLWSPLGQHLYQGSRIKRYQTLKPARLPTRPEFLSLLFDSSHMFLSPDLGLKGAPASWSGRFEHQRECVEVCSQTMSSTTTDHSLFRSYAYSRTHTSTRPPTCCDVVVHCCLGLFRCIFFL